MSKAFFIAQNGGYQATEHTVGPWSSKSQHASPPCTLICRELEAQADGMHIARISFDLLKPIPLSQFSIEVDQRVGGKRRRVLEARLIDTQTGICVVMASALLLRQQSVATGPLLVHAPEPPIGPTHEQTQPFQYDFSQTPVGYLAATEMRLAEGRPGTGKTRMWMRAKLPLLAGEDVSPLQHLMLVVDSGSGVSMALDLRQYSFMNADLTVNIRRPPCGEWICLDSTTHFQSFGLGLAETLIWDEQGVIGNASQNLLLEPLTKP